GGDLLGQHDGMPYWQGQDAGAEFEPVGVGGHHRQGDDGLQTKLLADNTIAEPEGVVAVGIPHLHQLSEEIGVLPPFAKGSRHVSDGNTHLTSFLIHVSRPAWVLAGMGQSRAFRLNLVTAPGGLTRGAGASRFTMQHISWATSPS